MTASLPAARSVDHMSMEARFSHPRRAYPRRWDRPFFVFLEALMKMELVLYQALIAIDVPEPKAEAVIQALESDMRSFLVTKSDLTSLEHRLSTEIGQSRSEVAQLEVKLTIRMGVMLSATIGILIAAMKFIH
jgi:hypothetical protein